jgi:hypothetical protein
MYSAQTEGMLPGVRRMFPTFLNVLLWRGWRVAAKLLVVLILLAGIVDLVAAIYFGGKLKSELASLKAAGKPLTVADLAPPPVDERENAFPLYMEAGEIVNRHAAGRQSRGGYGLTPDEACPFGYQDRQWDDPQVLACLEVLVEQDQRALDLVREAAEKPRYRSDLDWDHPLEAAFPHLNSARWLSHFLAASAVVAAERGDTAEALDRIRLGLVMARHVSEEPMLVSGLVVTGIDEVTMSAAQRVLQQGPIPEREARRLADELDGLDYSVFSQRGWESERAFGLYAFGLARRDRLLPFWTSVGEKSRLGRAFWWAYAYPLRPWLYADELQYLARMEAAERVMALPSSARARALVPRAARSVKERPPRWALMSHIVLPVFPAASTKALAAEAGRHLLRTAIGLELHRQDHGRYPRTLDELRKSGWDVPTDLFSGNDFVYRPAGDHFTLYSVGPNLRDDGGLVSVWPMSRHDRLPDGRKRVYDQDGDLVWSE